MHLGIARCRKVALPAIAALVLAFLGAGPAHAATQQYFDENGTGSGFGVANNGTYSWEDAAWSTDSAGGSATTTFIQDGTGFPRFQSTGTAGDAYTVNIGASEPAAGMALQGLSTTLTLNSSGGTVNLTTGLQGIFTTGGSKFFVNAVITGPGSVQPGSLSGGVGDLYLYGANTYTGTTSFSSSVANTYINNNSSLSSGTLFNNRAGANSFAPILPTATITLSNNITNNESGTFSSGLNFAGSANSPLRLNGQVRTGSGSNAFLLRNNGDNTSTVTFAGVISGADGITFSGVNGGAIILQGTDTLTGPIIVDSANSDNFQLELNNNSAVSTAASVTMANTLSKLRLDTSSVGMKGGSIAAVISGSGGLNKTAGTGTNTLIVSNASNAYTGVTTVTSGTLSLTASGAMQSSSGVSVAAAGTLDLGSFGQAIGTFSVSGYAGNGTLNPGGNGTIGNNGVIASALGLGATRTVTVSTNNTGTISGIVSGVGGLTKSGAGTLVLTNGGNSYGGVTTVSAGTLLFGVANAASSSPGISVTTNLNLGGFSQTVGSLSVAGGVYNGTATLGDTLALVDGGNVHSDATLNLNSGSRVVTIASGTGTIDGVLSGTGSGFDKQGAGAVVVTNAANTYDGTTTVSDGTLKLGVANAIASTTGVTLNGGALDSGVYVHAMTSAALTVAANSAIDVTSGGEIDFANSAAATWTPSTTLNVLGALGHGLLRFGTDATGLTSNQLNQIEFDSDPSSLGSAMLNNDGYLVPEPSGGLLVLGAALLLSNRRRRRVA